MVLLLSLLFCCAPGGSFGDIFIGTHHADLSRMHTEHYVLAQTTTTCFNRAILFGLWLISNVSGLLKGGGHAPGASSCRASIRPRRVAAIEVKNNLPLQSRQNICFFVTFN